MTSIAPFALDPSDPSKTFAFRALLNDPRFLERTVAMRLDDSAIDGRSMFGLVGTDTIAGSLQFYTANSSNSSGTTNTVFAVDTLKAVPFIVSNGFGVQALAFVVTTAGGGGSVARVGVYDCQDDLNGNIYPNRLLVDGGEQDTTGTGVKTSTIALLLEEGRMYWLAYTCGTSAPTISSIPPVGCDALLGMRAQNPPVRATHLTVARAYAALPFTFPTGAAVSAAGAPCLMYAFTRPSSTRKVRTVPVYHPASEGFMARRVRLSKGDGLRVTDPGRPYAILTAKTRGTSGSRSIGTFDTRANSLAAGADFRMNGVDVDFQMAVTDEVVVQIEQFGYPKVSLRDTTVFVDYIFTGAQ